MLKLVSFVAVIGFTWACNPIRVHPQSTYCSSNVVAKIKIESQTNEYETADDTRMSVPYFVYRGVILEMIKPTVYETHKTLIEYKVKHMLVRTPAQTSMCGPLTLKPEKTYLIAGHSSELGVVDVGIYHGAILLSDEDQYQDLLTKMKMYDIGCNCTVYMDGGFGYLNTSQQKGCSAGRLEKCKIDNGACMEFNDRCIYMHSCLGKGERPNVEIK